MGPDATVTLEWELEPVDEPAVSVTPEEPAPRHLYFEITAIDDPEPDLSA